MHAVIHVLLALLLCLFAINYACVEAIPSTGNKKQRPKGPILVVGATGSTGFRAIQGLLDVGYQSRQIRLLTRNAKSNKSKALKRAGFEIVQANLEKKRSLAGITKGCTGCYVHSTSSDTAELDTQEVQRAQNLVSAIMEQQKNHDICHIVYNSAAAQTNHGVGRIAQKHDVEMVLEKAIEEYNAQPQRKRRNKYLSFTSLRANIFMEELWKVYTRPQILEGIYPLPVPPHRKIYLVSVRDLGRLAGKFLSEEAQKEDHRPTIEKLNVAGDYLDPVDIAKAFANAQGHPCYHKNTKDFAMKIRRDFPELYEQILFLQTSMERTDVEGLYERFPGLLTNFTEFLEETKWGDKGRTFQNFGDISTLEQNRLRLRLPHLRFLG